MHVNISKTNTFYPEFCDNLDFPKEEQIRVEYKFPTIALKERISTQNKAKAIADNNGNIDHMEIEMAIDEQLLLKSIDLKIYNCSYGDESNPTIINNAKELFEAPSPFNPLKAEIVKEVQKSFEVVAEKNSE